MQKWVLVTLLCVIQAACASDIGIRRIEQLAEAEVIPGKILAAPIRSVASVGDVMLTAGEFSATPSQTRLPAFNLTEQVPAVIQHKLRTFEFELPAGEYVLLGKSDDGLFYGAPKPLEEKSNRKGYGGLFVAATAPQSATEIFWNWQPAVRRGSAFFVAKLPVPIPVSPRNLIRQLNDGIERGPRATLTYAGVAGGQIRFVYKEFTSDGFARPAFTQEVGLDYKEGETYAYKDARFIVEKADTTHVEFILITGL